MNAPYLSALALALANVPVAAEELGEEAEQYADIVVTARITDDRVVPPQVELTSEALLAAQPISIADALRSLPGVSVKTNSRGETIARIRGAEERQTAVFFEGSPFSVPWDGRMDLAILPAALIGHAVVSKGAAPIEYGANAVAGVVDLQARSGAGGENGITGLAEVGSLGHVNTSAVATAGNDRFDLTLAGSYFTRDAQPVAELDALPFSQADSKRRTNTDLRSFSLFAAAGGRAGPVEARVSILHNDSARGIAPESDRDPAVFAPRYWRYPKIALTQLNANLEADLADGVTLNGAFFRQWFDQVIDAYRTASYTALRSRQQDDDNTHGGRLTLAFPAGPLTVRTTGSLQTANHRQIDTAFPGTAGPRLEYEQRLASVGSEVDIPLAATTRMTVGAAYDHAKTPLTGDKPAQPSQDALAFSASLRHELGEDLDLTLSAGRRTRFASARELFGEALGRFLINPDLKPERASMIDAELAWTPADLQVRLNPFYIRGEDTIGQRNVGSRRQRYNLGGTTVLGIDGSLSDRLADRLWLELAGSLLKAQAGSGDALFRRLPQRPSHTLSGALDYRVPERFDLRAEVLRTGGAVDLAPDNRKARLPASTEFNLRGSIALLRLPTGGMLSFTAAIDNLTDELVLPQLGLPASGRTIRVGFRVE
ncbi:TonB-dependent receptor plug domain-containing protein [Sphingoaurantiacus capsulatus]|uniref:TonB-dependent receptor plug domain-containing protein n=1 Tax=Sphingoaurantiacus capsulatus TaxID=1771310 RepID=A0ABV7XD44_9SPHN